MRSVHQLNLKKENSNQPTLYELIRDKSEVFHSDAIDIIARWSYPYTPSNEIDSQAYTKEAKLGTLENNKMIRESERFLEFVNSSLLPHGWISNVGSDITQPLAKQDIKKVYETLAALALTVYSTTNIASVQENCEKAFELLVESKIITINDAFCSALQEISIKSNPEKSFEFLKELGANLTFPCPTPQGEISAIDLAIQEKNPNMFRALVNLGVQVPWLEGTKSVWLTGEDIETPESLTWDLNGLVMYRRFDSAFPRWAGTILSWRLHRTSKGDIDSDLLAKERAVGIRAQKTKLIESQNFLKFVTENNPHVPLDLYKSLVNLVLLVATSTYTPQVRENYKQGILHLINTKKIDVYEMYCTIIQEPTIKFYPEKSLKLLQELGADLNAPCSIDGKKLTAMEIALGEDNFKMVKALFDLGVKIEGLELEGIESYCLIDPDSVKKQPEANFGKEAAEKHRWASLKDLTIKKPLDHLFKETRFSYPGSAEIRELNNLIDQWRRPATLNNQESIWSKFKVIFQQYKALESEEFFQFASNATKESLSPIAYRELIKLILIVYWNTQMPQVKENYEKGIRLLMNSNLINIHEIYCEALQESAMLFYFKHSFSFFHDLGVDPNHVCPAPDGKNFTAMELVIAKGNLEMVKALLALGAKPIWLGFNGERFICTAKDKDKEMAKFLEEHGGYSYFCSTKSWKDYLDYYWGINEKTLETFNSSFLSALLFGSLFEFLKKSNFSPTAIQFASLFLQIVITYMTGSWLSAGTGLITTLQLRKTNTLSDRNAGLVGMILSMSLQIAEFSLPGAMKVLATVLGTVSGSFVGQKLTDITFWGGGKLIDAGTQTKNYLMNYWQEKKRQAQRGNDHNELLRKYPISETNQQTLQSKFSDNLYKHITSVIGFEIPSLPVIGSSGAILDLAEALIELRDHRERMTLLTWVETPSLTIFDIRPAIQLRQLLNNLANFLKSTPQTSNEDLTDSLKNLAAQMVYSYIDKETKKSVATKLTRLNADENIFINDHGLFVIGKRSGTTRDIKDQDGNYYSANLQSDFFKMLEEEVIIPHLNQISKDSKIWQQVFSTEKNPNKSKEESTTLALAP